MQVQQQQSQQLGAAYYGKGIAVYGPTQAWKEDLKTLGGRYNPNLGGQPGWIFGKAREPELMQFLANANAGVVRPTPAPVAQRSPYRQQAPAIQAMPGMAPLPTIQPIRSAPVQPVRSARPKLTVVDRVDFDAGVLPLHFVDDSGQEYRMLWYSVPMPHEGQPVRIDYDPVIIPDPPQLTYVASNVTFDQFDITVQETGEKMKVELIRGEWQLRNAPAHKIILLPAQMPDLEEVPVQ